MVISPIEIQKKEFAKVLRGYSPEQVREYLDDIAKSYEKVYTENRELQDQIEALKDKIEHYKQLEDTLKNTLVLAEKTADEVINNAKREKQLILKQTMDKATKILKVAEDKYEDVSQEIEELRRQFYLYKTRFTNFLKSQLELVESFEASNIAEFNDLELHLREVAIAKDEIEKEVEEETKDNTDVETIRVKADGPEDKPINGIYVDEPKIMTEGEPPEQE